MKSHENKMQKWDDSKQIKHFLDKSGIKIEPLKETMILDLIAMTQANRNLPGFEQMMEEVFRETNNIFHQCIPEDSQSKCLVAFNKTNGKMIGFIVFASNEEGAAIRDLGVDASSTYNPERTDGPKNVGSALLLAACNQVFCTATASEISVVASMKAGVDFYRHRGFIVDPNGDDTYELILQRENYKYLESSVFSRAKLVDDNNRLFHHSSHSDAEVDKPPSRPRSSNT